MDHKHLTPQARRAQDASRARVETRKIEDVLPLWQIAALVLTGVVLLALI